MFNKKLSDGANFRSAYFEKREIVYSGVKQSGQLLFVSIFLHFHEYPSIRKPYCS